MSRIATLLMLMFMMLEKPFDVGKEPSIDTAVLPFAVFRISIHREEREEGERRERERRRATCEKETSGWGIIMGYMRGFIDLQTACTSLYQDSVVLLFKKPKYQ